jgi:hypothetical protein
MGADLYIKEFTDAAKLKYNHLFRKTCETRDNLSATYRAWNNMKEQLQPLVDLGKPTDLYRAAESKMEALDKQINAAQKEVGKYYDLMFPSRGYFRDSYNGTSVLWRINLSWWQDVQGGTQTVKSLTNFLKKLKSSKMKPITTEELIENGCKVDKSNTSATWSKYYRNKKRRLVRFIERAIASVKRGNEVNFSL